MTENQFRDIFVNQTQLHPFRTFLVECDYECCVWYYDIEGKNFDELEWVKECVTSVKRMLLEAQDKLSAAHELTLLPDGPYMYGELLEKEAEMMGRAAAYESYDELYDAVRGISFDRLPAKKDDSVSPEKKERAKEQGFFRYPPGSLFCLKFIDTVKEKHYEVPNRKYYQKF